MSSRADRHDNPIAFTTDIARQAHLIAGKDYATGESFLVGTHTYYTAKLLHDPLDMCMYVIDALGFYTNGGLQRWAYIGMPLFVWQALSKEQKIRVIQFMYSHEGGTALTPLFKL